MANAGLRQRPDETAIALAREVQQHGFVMGSAAMLADVYRREKESGRVVELASAYGLTQNTMRKAGVSAYDLAVLLRAFRREPRGERLLKQ